MNAVANHAMTTTDVQFLPLVDPKQNDRFVAKVDFSVNPAPRRIAEKIKALVGNENQSVTIRTIPTKSTKSRGINKQDQATHIGLV
jgi:hypothetical protein